MPAPQFDQFCTPTAGPGAEVGAGRAGGVEGAAGGGASGFTLDTIGLGAGAVPPPGPGKPMGLTGPAPTGGFSGVALKPPAAFEVVVCNFGASAYFRVAALIN